MLSKKNTILLSILGLIFISNLDARAQEIKAEEQRVSGIVNIWLPDDTKEIAPEAVPAVIKQKLEQMTAEFGNGRNKQYDSEVLMWGGESYKKRGSETILKRLTDQIANTKEWLFEAGKTQNNITPFKV